MILWSVLFSIASSIVTSAIVTKILATHYFKIVDGYVDDMCQKTKEFVDTTQHKLT